MSSATALSRATCRRERYARSSVSWTTARTSPSGCASRGEARMAKVTRIGRVIIPVSDQDNAIAFYKDKLGFEVTTDVAFGEGDRWVEMAPPSGGTGIALSKPQGSYAPGRETGLAIESTDVRADHEDLKGAGVAVEDLWGGDGTVPLGFMFRDADGNGLMIVEAGS